MIGWFPTPFPDELLYSACARYDDLTRYPNRHGVDIDLFGRKNIRVSIDLPCNLRCFTMMLPPNDSYTVDNIIDQHSLLNFYAPFLDSARVTRIRREMEMSDAKLVHKLVGLNSIIKFPIWLRYCPSCVIHDRQQYGETYWHRLHQCPGVQVCLKHEVFLEDSNVAARSLPYAGFSCAERVALTSHPRGLSGDNRCHQIHLNIARDAAWLLTSQKPLFRPEAVYTGYMTILRERGFTTLNGHVRIDRLTEAVKTAYPDELLQSVQSPLTEHQRWPWVRAFTKTLLRQKPVHPLRFLLMAQFLGFSAESFFELSQRGTLPPATNDIFGRGPYPCLNPTCTDFNKRVIRKVTISFRWEHPDDPVGIFSCDCGYSYARVGTAASACDVFHRDTTRTYGPVWEAELIRMWHDGTLFIKAISKALGVGRLAVKYHAVRLGLPFPRLGPSKTVTRVKTSYKSRVMKSRRSQIMKVKRTTLNREKWSIAVSKNPGASRTNLQQIIAPQAYRWLRKYDKAWLEGHMPASRNLDPKTLNKRLVIYDAKVAATVPGAVSSIKRIPGLPQRVTKTSISRHLKIQKSLLQKLPLTMKAMSELADSYLSFALRRIDWATDYCNQTGISPGYDEFARLAHLSYMNLFHTPELRTAVEATLPFLQQATTQAMKAARAA